MNRVTPLLVALLAGTALAPLEAQAAQVQGDGAVQPEAAAPPATETAPAPSTPAAPAVENSGQAAPEGEEEGDEEAIVVTGQRPRGSVAGDIQPEVTINARQIRAYGAGSLSDLLDALSPQTQSGRGRGGERPIILLNGRRISGWQEIRDIPPEAIERVDILPEEVALKYGYRADSRVVNFVLRQRFRALTTEVAGGMATRGGGANFMGDVNLLRIDQRGRWNVDVKYSQQDALFESERNIIQAGASAPFDLTGNVGPAGTATQIDPALSALVGSPVTVAAVPQSAAAGRPTLNSFVPGANNAAVTDTGDYRTLRPRTQNLAVNGTLNRTVFGDVSATVNGTYELSSSESALGLPSLSLIIPRSNPFTPFGSDVALFRYVDTPNPIGSDSNTQTGHIGIALNGDSAPWRWSITGNYDRSSSRSFTGLGLDPTGLQAAIDSGSATLNPFGTLPSGLIVARPDDQARSTSQSGQIEAVASGPLFTLPAGKVQTTLKAAGQFTRFDSDTLRAGIAQSRHFSRNESDATANVDIPLTSRRTGFLSAVGDLSANFNLELNQLSDFGTLTTYGYGINWRPIPPVSVIASVTQEQGAPSMQQLGNPTVLTPNVRVFDFVRGETVEISRLDGGNPLLRSDNRRVMKLGLNIKPFSNKDLSFSANYTNNRIRNPIASFPTATAEIEAAFPDRFVRDADGRLLRIDSRPVNFQRSTREQLRWGVNFSTALGKAPEPPPGGFRRFGGADGRRGGEAPQGQNPNGQSANGQGLNGQPADGQTRRPQADQGGGGFFGGRGGFGGGGRGGGRFGGGGFGGASQARIQLALYHTWHFADEVLIRPGVPKLDFLNGSASGSAGGQPRHEIEAQAGIFKNGFGARLTGNWQSATRIEGGTLGSSAGDLRFSSLATVNLRLFADLGLQRKLATKIPFLRGARVSLSVDNLFDSRIDVRDATGVTPLSYQPGYLDPLGRTVRISFRKLFF